MTLKTNAPEFHCIYESSGPATWRYSLEKKKSSRTFLHVLLITLRPAKLHVSLAPWPMPTKAQVR